MVVVKRCRGKGREGAALPEQHQVALSLLLLLLSTPPGSETVGPREGGEAALEEVPESPCSSGRPVLNQHFFNPRWVLETVCFVVGSMS